MAVPIPGQCFLTYRANLVFAGDESLRDLVVPDGQEAVLVAGSLAKSAVITVDGQRIGVVGAYDAELGQNYRNRRHHRRASGRDRH